MRREAPSSRRRCASSTSARRALRLDAAAPARTSAVARRAGADRDRQRRGRARAGRACDLPGARASRSGAGSTRCSARFEAERRSAHGAPRRPPPELAFPYPELRARAGARSSPRSSAALEQRRAPAARGADRHRQDRRRALSGAALRARPRQAALRAHRQDPAAGDGDPGPRRCSTRTTRFHSLRLRAKAKMCANDEVLCHEEYCPFARDYYSEAAPDRRRAAAARASTATLEPDAVFATPRATPRSVRSRSASSSPGAPRSWSATTTTPSIPTSRSRDFGAEADLSRHDPGRRRDPQPGRPRARLLQPRALGRRGATGRPRRAAAAARRCHGAARRLCSRARRRSSRATVDGGARRAAGGDPGRSRRAARG